MSALPALGRLVTLPAREVWANEAQVFTPWLAGNLDLLSEALGIGELELQATEYVVGDFRLDILAEDGEGRPVMIENQFGATDHGHLGQLLSYVASEGRPSSIVWVAERFRDSHRAAVDWLNANTGADYALFAVEIEALRIGDSVPAPFFNVVAKPNNWTKAVRAATSTGSPAEAERHRVRRSYWAAFAAYLQAHDPTFVIRRECDDHWFPFKIGRVGIHITATISTQKRRVGVELYLADDPYKTGIRTLLVERAAIEEGIGEALSWQELPRKKGSRIALFLTGVDPADPAQFDRLQAWMLDKMQCFRRVFADRVRNLDLGPGDDVEDVLG